MEEQRRRAQASWKGGIEGLGQLRLYAGAIRPPGSKATAQTLSTGCEVLAIIKPHNGTGCWRVRS